MRFLKFKTIKSPCKSKFVKCQTFSAKKPFSEIFMPNKLVGKKKSCIFDILARPTKFPTIFSQSNGFRLTGMNVDKSQMIKKNLMLTEEENETDKEKSKTVK